MLWVFMLIFIGYSAAQVPCILPCGLRGNNYTLEVDSLSAGNIVFDESGMATTFRITLGTDATQQLECLRIEGSFVIFRITDGGNGFRCFNFNYNSSNAQCIGFIPGPVSNSEDTCSVCTGGGASFTAQTDSCMNAVQPPDCNVPSNCGPLPSPPPPPSPILCDDAGMLEIGDCDNTTPVSTTTTTTKKPRKRCRHYNK